VRRSSLFRRIRRFARKTVATVRRPDDLGLRILLLAFAIVAIVAPALLVHYGPRVVVVHGHIIRAPHRHVVPKAELPPVEPVTFQDLAPGDARDYNATVPFSTDPNPAARPFHIAGTPDQRARATDCLAAAMLYEAGDDNEGQRAVGQVIINRVRHPAFPKTICGVVFQGSERTTGCQFTFTCDGALVRHGWRPEQWARARTQAAASLGGQVFGAVGYATHYHTDWVVPYWQSSLDKVAAVHTHLFFRWSGWWGTPPAFNRTVSSDEPFISKLAPYSPAHGNNGSVVPLPGTVVMTEQEVAARALAAPAVGLASDPETFLITIDQDVSPQSYGLLASRICGQRRRCKVMAWANKAQTPSAMPLDAGQISTMVFSYMRDQAFHYDKALWNCAIVKRDDAGECMKTQVLLPKDPATNPPVTPNTPGAAPTPVENLSGVRRKPDGPSATPTPPAKTESSLSAESR
jgi:spore germination cell wall hydrolase CwlJ-like protein